jgi:hypothetical protein
MLCAAFQLADLTRGEVKAAGEKAWLMPSHFPAQGQEKAIFPE